MLCVDADDDDAVGAGRCYQPLTLVPRTRVGVVGSRRDVRVHEPRAGDVAEGELRGAEAGAHRVEGRDGRGEHDGAGHERREALSNLGEREIAMAVVGDEVDEHGPSVARSPSAWAWSGCLA